MNAERSSLLPALRILLARIADHDGHDDILVCLEDCIAAARAGIVLIDQATKE